MGCNRDSRCINIANVTYPKLQGEINSSIKTITSSLNEITSELSALTIPEDYLGQKVKKQLESIVSNLDSDQGNIVDAGGTVGMFIGKRVEEHRNHYNAWKRAQDALKKRKEEEINNKLD